MIINVLITILLLQLSSFVQTFSETKIQFLVDHALSTGTNQQQYSDDPHRMPFTSFQLNSVNPSFTIVGKFCVIIDTTKYQSLFQIFNTSNPNQKLIMFGFDEQLQSIFVRQQFSANSYQGQILCSNIQDITLQTVQFTLSLRKTTQIDIDFKITQGSKILCSQTQSFTTNMLSWNFSSYSVQFSDAGVSGSRAEYAVQGSVYSVFLIKDIYIKSYGQIASKFIESLALNTQESLSILNQFNPIKDIPFSCVPDESIAYFACGKSNTTSTLPTIKNGIASFNKNQDILYKNFYLNYLYYHYYRFIPSTFISFSFWLYLDDFFTGTQIQVFQIYDNILKVLLLPNSNGFKIQIILISGNNQSIWESPIILNIKKYYYAIISSYQFSNYDLRIIIIDDTGSLQEFLFINQYYLGTYTGTFNLQIGCDKNIMDTFFNLSQFQMNISTAILYDEPNYPIIVDSVSIIKNCQVVILIRLKYQCMVCKIGFYLYENTCNNSCNSDYTPNQSIRTCIRKCSYRCATCDSNNPNLCTSCSSSDRDISTNCGCKQGYEDKLRKDCLTFKPLNINNSEIEITDKYLNAGESTTFNYTRIFKTVPQIIPIILTTHNFNSYIKGVKTNIYPIDNQQYKIKTTGSYGGPPNQVTDFNIWLIFIDNNTGKYYSKTLQFDTLIQSSYQKDIEIGTYDIVKYGDYQVLTFISGFFMGSDTYYTTIQADFKIDVINNKQQIQVTVNNYVKMVQVTYLILPISIPSLFSQYTFNTGTFFSDSTNIFSSKVHSDTKTIPHQQIQQKKYLINSIFSLTGMNYQIIRTNFRYSFAYATQNELDKQYTRFLAESSQLKSYQANGIYLIEQIDPQFDKCIIKDIYTIEGCYFCKIQYADPEKFCDSCKGNRILNITQCDCPDPDFQKIYTDEINCSFNQTAVLNVDLSTDFSLLTIDFGLNIEPIHFQLSFEPSIELCQYLFQQDTINLISQSATCQIFSSIIIVHLDHDASILKDNVIQFNQNLKFTKYDEKITQYLRTVVRQDPLDYVADVDIQYQQEVSKCDQNIIQVIEFKNHQRRGVLSFQWELVSESSPNNSNDLTKIQQLIDDANQQKQLSLNTYGYFVENSSLEFRFKFNYRIGINGEKLIKFNVVTKTSLILTQAMKQNAPFYRKDSFDIFYSISYYNCDLDNNPVQIYPATFELKYSTSNNLQLTNTISSTSDRSFSVSIPQYSTTSNIEYKITVTCTVSGTTFQAQIDYLLKILPIPLLIYINGGNRQHAYSQELTIDALVKDLDVDPNQNQSQGINLIWSCISLETSTACTDIEDSVIPITQGSNSITFPKNTFLSLTTLQFTIIGIKDSRQEKSQISIQFIDNSIPLLKIQISDYIIIKKTINLNDKIEVNIYFDSQENVNNLFFGAVLIYNRVVQTTINFEHGKIRLQVWDYFTKFNLQNPKFQIRFMIFNPKYTQPSQTILQLKLNFPPQKCLLNISPSSGYSLVTLFSISVSNCEDPDQPIQYQFYYYTQPQLFEFEKINPFQVQRKQLSDKIFNSVVQTYLPSGDILILVQVTDSLNAIQNITQAITITQSAFNEQDYISLVQNLINYSQIQIPSVQTLILSLLCEDIIQRTKFYTAIRDQTEQIVTQLNKISNSISKFSTFSILATQQVQQIIDSKILQNSSSFLQSNLNNVKIVLEKATVELNGQQFLQDKSNQQLYNCFNILDKIAQTPQINQEIQKNIIKYSEILGDLLNVDAFPNESAKVFIGQKISIISQVITSKKLIQYLGMEEGSLNLENQIIDKNQIYAVSFKQYDENLYQSESEFQTFIQQVKQTNLTFTLNSYMAINPSIKLYKSENNQTFNSDIKLNFKPIDSETLTCVNKAKGQWSSQGCESVYDKKLKQYSCICDQISPVTVVNDISDLFQKNKNVDAIFSESGINNILGFSNFQDFAAFWVECFIAIIFIILSVVGRFLDQQRSSTQQFAQVSPNIMNLGSPSSKPISIDEYQKSEEVADSQQDIYISTARSNKTRQPSIYERSLTTKNDFSSEIQSNFKNQNSLEKRSQKKHSIALQVQYMKSIQEEVETKYDDKGSESHILSKSKRDPKKKQNDYNSSLEKEFYKKKGLFGQIFYYHDLFQIFLIFDPQVSRVQRMIIIYVKNLHIFTINIVFNQSYSIIQVIFLQSINIICSIIITKIIELGIAKNRILRRVCQVLIISLILFYYYAFLAVISGTQPSDTNMISLCYFIILLVDVFVVAMFLAFVQRLIVNLFLINNQNFTGLKLIIAQYVKLQLIIKNI